MEKKLWKCIIFFSKTCSLFWKHHLLLTFIHKYTFILGLRHTHRWISACLCKGECETEVHVCYYFIIRSANAVRSQTHTIVCAHTACVLWRLLWLLIQVSDNWELASAKLFEFQQSAFNFDLCINSWCVHFVAYVWSNSHNVTRIFFFAQRWIIHNMTINLYLVVF